MCSWCFGGKACSFCLACGLLSPPIRVRLHSHLLPALHTSELQKWMCQVPPHLKCITILCGWLLLPKDRLLKEIFVILVRLYFVVLFCALLSDIPDLACSFPSNILHGIQSSLCTWGMFVFLQLLSMERNVSFLYQSQVNKFKSHAEWLKSAVSFSGLR